MKAAQKPDESSKKTYSIPVKMEETKKADIAKNDFLTPLLTSVVVNLKLVNQFQSTHSFIPKHIV